MNRPEDDEAREVPAADDGCLLDSTEPAVPKGSSMEDVVGAAAAGVRVTSRRIGSRRLCGGRR
jgi:hypothetical protein